MAATDSNTALFDQTKQSVPPPPLRSSPSAHLASSCRLLATFTQHAFESHRLASSVPVRDLGRLAQYHGSLGGGNGNTENYTRWTQGATDLTGVSGVSDEGLIMDAGDRGRATEDLKLFKVRRRRCGNAPAMADQRYPSPTPRRNTSRTSSLPTSSRTPS